MSLRAHWGPPRHLSDVRRVRDLAGYFAWRKYLV